MQQITPSTAETVLTHAEKWPMSFVAVLLIAALAYWLLFKFWPAWLLEQEKHRDHLAKALAQRGVEAQEDIAAATKLHESQQTTLVKELGGRIDKTHEKIGVTVLTIFLFGPGFIAGFALGNSTGRAMRADGAAKCSNPCASGFYCCGENKCCERKTSPASNRTSALAFSGLGQYAQPRCNYRVEVCR